MQVVRVRERACGGNTDKGKQEKEEEEEEVVVEARAAGCVGGNVLSRTRLVGELDLRDLGVRARRQDLDQAVLVGARAGHRVAALLRTSHEDNDLQCSPSSNARVDSLTMAVAVAGTLASNSAGESSRETIACSKLPLSSFLMRSIRSCTSTRGTWHGTCFCLPTNCQFVRVGSAHLPEHLLVERAQLLALNVRAL